MPCHGDSDGARVSALLTADGAGCMHNKQCSFSFSPLSTQMRTQTREMLRNATNQTRTGVRVCYVCYVREERPLE